MKIDLKSNIVCIFCMKVFNYFVIYYGVEINILGQFEFFDIENVVMIYAMRQYCIRMYKGNYVRLCNLYVVVIM